MSEQSPDIVEQAANLFGSAQALVDGEIDWSFNDLHFHVQKWLEHLFHTA